MKKIFFLKFFNKCLKKLKNKKLFYNQNTYNSYNDIKLLLYSILNLNINKKYYTIKIYNWQIKKIFKLIKLRIKKRIPMAYLTKKTFYNNKLFYINKNVLIPRSPILNIINNKFKCIKKNYYPKKILDLCTGCGCIAIHCSYLFKKSYIDATDICPKALKIAKKNILLHKINNINLIKTNLFKNIKSKYDLIITNPPYVSYKEFKYLPKEYYYEPSIALKTTNSGLYIIQNIIKNYNNFLKKKGILICEVGNKKKIIKKIYKNIKLNWIIIKNIKYNIFYIKKN